MHTNTQTQKTTGTNNRERNESRELENLPMRENMLARARMHARSRIRQGRGALNRFFFRSATNTHNVPWQCILGIQLM